MEKNQLKQKLILLEDDPDKKEEFLLELVKEAQIADVAKTRIRQSLKLNHREEIEKYLCPEIYDNTNHEKKSRKITISFILSLAASAAAIFGFFYTVYQDKNREQKEMLNKVTIMYEKIRTLEVGLNNNDSRVYRNLERIQDLDKRLFLLENRNVPK